MVLIFISLMSNDKYLYLSIFFVNCLCKLFHSFLIDCLSFYYLVKRVLYKLRISILFQMFCKYFLIYGLPIYFLNGITYQQKLLILTGTNFFIFCYVYCFLWPVCLSNICLSPGYEDILLYFL